ncbi:MAG: aldo/keto reductase [Candidatus Sumerlaeia bacterium]|nr:aldo/keto reductase [Candidatus Sumerlaeia bacterium]
MDRRRFLNSAAGAAGLTLLGAPPIFAAPESGIPKPTDLVTLGKTGVKMTRIAVGTGTVGGNKSSKQTRAGQEMFTRIVRRAYDAGIRFFDCADSYGSMPFLKVALEGIPRDKVVILTKVGGDKGEKAQLDVERFLKELGTDYIDILLTHCARTADWATRRAGVLEVLSKAKEKGLARAIGLSWHGKEPLETVADTAWGDFALVRINHKGINMDGPPEEVVPHIKKIHERGKFVMGMKILGEGKITEPEEINASLRFVLGLGTVGAMTIGFEKPEQVDDMLARWEAAMKDVAKAAA